MYWKELTIIMLVILSIILALQRKVVRYGSTETYCHTDTAYIYKDAMIIYKNKVAYIRAYKTDTLSLLDSILVTDTILDYALIEIPFNEYQDSQFYARTLGWLDSVVIYPKFRTIEKEVKVKDKSTLFLTGSFGKELFAPSLNYSIDKYQIGAGYNTVNGTFLLNIGYRIK